MTAVLSVCKSHSRSSDFKVDGLHKEQVNLFINCTYLNERFNQNVMLNVLSVNESSDAMTIQMPTIKAK